MQSSIIVALSEIIVKLIITPQINGILGMQESAKEVVAVAVPPCDANEVGTVSAAADIVICTLMKGVVALYLDGMQIG